MSGGRTVTLPARQEMLKRLRSVNNSPHVVEYLYPELLEYASQDMTAIGIVAMLRLELGKYCDRFIVNMYAIMETQIPSFIKVLVRDRRVQQEALQLLGERPAR